MSTKEYLRNEFLFTRSHKRYLFLFQFYEFELKFFTYYKVSLTAIHKYIVVDMQLDNKILTYDAFYKSYNRLNVKFNTITDKDILKFDKNLELLKLTKPSLFQASKNVQITIQKKHTKPKKKNDKIVYTTIERNKETNEKKFVYNTNLNTEVSNTKDLFKRN